MINVSLPSFKGPLDLLLNLIEKDEIDIWDINITTLTDQYMEYMDGYCDDMDSMSEFILMAATLLEIKSKMLLPQSKQDVIEAEISREELILKLIEYKKFKEISGILMKKTENSTLFFYKSPDPELASISKARQPDASEILDGLTLSDLRAAFEDVLKRRNLKIDKIRSGFDSVPRDVFTIEEKSQHLLNLLTLFEKISFYDIFPGHRPKIEIIVTFLALLELLKRNLVMIYQKDIFSDIYIMANRL